MTQRVILYCSCGHHATVTLEGQWKHRDWILPRARCSKCGRLGADHLQVAQDPGTVPGGGYTGAV